MFNTYGRRSIIYYFSHLFLSFILSIDCNFSLFIFCNNFLYSDTNLFFRQVVSRHAARGWEKGLCAMSHTPIGGHPQGNNYFCLPHQRKGVNVIYETFTQALDSTYPLIKIIL